MFWPALGCIKTGRSACNAFLGLFLSHREQGREGRGEREEDEREREMFQMPRRVGCGLPWAVLGTVQELLHRLRSQQVCCLVGGDSVCHRQKKKKKITSVQPDEADEVVD